MSKGAAVDLLDVDEHRRQVGQITSMAVEDVTAYAEQIEGESPEQVAAQLREAVPAIVTVYGGVAAESGALFYEQQRPTYRAARTAAPSIGETLSDDLGWAFLPLFKPDLFDSPMLDLVSRLGGLTQKHVAAGDRDTIVLSSSMDPDAYGVRRYARANACAFCRYLSVAEADVTESTIWHRDCHCVTVPWWEDNPLPEAPYMADWAASAEKARQELERQQAEAKPPGMRWSNFYRSRPDLTLTNRNITRLMREDLGISH